MFFAEIVLSLRSEIFFDNHKIYCMGSYSLVYCLIMLCF